MGSIDRIDTYAHIKLHSIGSGESEEAKMSNGEIFFKRSKLPHLLYRDTSKISEGGRKGVLLHLAGGDHET